MGPHLGGIDLMAGEFPGSERAGQRTSGHVSSIGESEHHSLSDIQSLPSAIPVFRPPAYRSTEARSRSGYLASTWLIWRRR